MKWSPELILGIIFECFSFKELTWLSHDVKFTLNKCNHLPLTLLVMIYQNSDTSFTKVFQNQPLFWAFRVKYFSIIWIQIGTCESGLK